MGFLNGGFSASESSGDTESAGSAESAATEEPAAPEQQTEPAAAPEPPKGERVQVPSRRGAAAAKRDAIEQKLSALESQHTKTVEQMRQDLAQRDAELARLRGGFEAIQPFLAQRQQAPAPAAPDPDQLAREARALLDSGDFDGYQRKTMEATEARILAKIPRQQPAPPAQAPISPVVSALMAQHPKVLEAGDRGVQLAVIKDQELAVMGVPNGPDRWRRAFEMASTALGGTAQQPASYSQASREVLSGVPTARGGAKGTDAGPGVTLSAYEVEVARRCGMTKEEYVQYIIEAHPERVEQR